MMSKHLTVAALQLPTLGMNATRLEYYLKKANERGAKVMLLGEYVLNHFFKELAQMPKGMIKAQSKTHLMLMKKLAVKYDMIFIAPLIVVKKNRLYKTIAKITPKNTRYYHQQILINYEHWDEKSFFANEVKPLETPPVFKIKGFKVMLMAGFELHFEPLWRQVMRKKIDLVLIPSASTFASHNRWREIIKTQAFLHGCYVLRANRLGEYVEKDIKWRFYGDTMLVNPQGEVEMMLEDKESMLVEEISKQAVAEHRRLWRFEKALKEHGAL
jgi:predicted amidohydrolase